MLRPLKVPLSHTLRVGFERASRELLDVQALRRVRGSFGARDAERCAVQRERLALETRQGYRDYLRDVTLHTRETKRAYH